jgi:hypothetical protein
LSCTGGESKLRSAKSELRYASFVTNAYLLRREYTHLAIARQVSLAHHDVMLFFGQELSAIIAPVLVLFIIGVHSSHVRASVVKFCSACP